MKMKKNLMMMLAACLAQRMRQYGKGHFFERVQ